MQTYVFLCKFTAEGIKGVREGAQRRQAAREGKVAILEGVQASQPGRERRQGGKEGSANLRTSRASPPSPASGVRTRVSPRRRTS